MPQKQQQTEGLPRGATLKPIEGLPSGAELRPIDNSQSEPTTAEAKPGNAFTSGHPIDTFVANVDDAMQPYTAPERRGDSMAESAKYGLKRGLASTIAYPIAHPFEAVKGLATTARDFAVHSSPYDFENPLNRMIQSTVEDYQEGGPTEATANLLGQLGGGWAMGETGGAALRGAGRMAAPIGRAMERGGMDTLNSFAGQTKPMRLRGQSPAAAMIDEGLTPAMSRYTLTNGTEGASQNVGSRLGNMFENSKARIPSEKIDPAIETPIQRALDVARGPGLGGPTDDRLMTLQDKMAKPAPGATRPIYSVKRPIVLNKPYDPTAPIDNVRLMQGTQDASVPDIWKSIRNIDEKTRFNPDPEVEGVNEVQRDIRGGLRPLLEEAVPGSKELSRRYSNLKALEEGLERTGSPTKLSKLGDIFGTPITTSVGTGMVRGGRMLQTPVDPFLSRTVPATTDLFMGAKSPRKENR